MCQKNPATNENKKLCADCVHDIDVGGRYKKSRAVCADLDFKRKDPKVKRLEVMA